MVELKEVLEVLRGLKADNMNKLVWMGENPTQEEIAKNTKINEFRLGADLAYETAITKIKELNNTELKGDID